MIDNRSRIRYNERGHHVFRSSAGSGGKRFGTRLPFGQNRPEAEAIVNMDIVFVVVVFTGVLLWPAWGYLVLHALMEKEV